MKTPRARGSSVRSGFTLIEVMGALVIFSAGILGIMRAGSALTTQLRHAGAWSHLVVLTDERIDSIQTMPFDSIVAGTVQDTLNVQGWTYERVVTVTDVTPVLARIEVSMRRTDSGGPSHSVTSFTSSAW